MRDEALRAMQASIVNGAPETAAVLAQDALTAGFEPLDAINLGFVPGMHAVGEQFAQHTLFLPDMMASAEAMRAAMQVLEPELRKRGGERPNAGTVVLGTTKGDIHEIGKTLVGTLLTAHGFKVHDLGVDVANVRADLLHEPNSHRVSSHAPLSAVAPSKLRAKNRGTSDHFLSWRSDGPVICD